MKRIEDIEGLPEQEKIFDYIDLVIRDLKIKKSTCLLMKKPGTCRVLCKGLVIFKLNFLKTITYSGR